MHIYPFKGIFPDPKLITSADSFAKSAKQNYNEYQQSQLMINKEVPRFYIYQIKTKKGTLHTGLVTGTATKDFDDGLIKKHEQTIREKEQMQMQLFLRWKAILKPVLLIYPEVTDINKVIHKYCDKHPSSFEYYFSKHKEVHNIWIIEDEHVASTLQNLFKKKVKSTYIADGHHRTSTVSLLNKMHQKETNLYDQIFTVYFPASETQIYEYNRIVKGLNGLSHTTFIAKLSNVCTIVPLSKGRKPKRKYDFTILLDGEYFLCTWRPSTLAKYSKQEVILDADLLNKEVLGPILGIEDIRDSELIDYMDGVKRFKSFRNAVSASPEYVGFYLYPIKLKDMYILSDEGNMLPPKSTWFEPRMKSGIIIRPFK